MYPTRWAVATVFLFVLGGSFHYLRQAEVVFSGLRAAQARLQTAGFHCNSDSEHGNATGGFLVSHVNVTWAEAGSLCKIGPMGPKWKGKVWVTFNSDIWQLRSLPENAGMRVWGNVVAYGDEDLLNEIDGALEQASASIF